MSLGPLTGALARLAAGIAIGLPAAALVFAGEYPSVAEAKFAALVAATLLSTALILVRLVSHVQAAILVALLAGACASFLARLTGEGGLAATAAGVLAGFGAWLAAWVVETSGWRFVVWRALLAGSLFGGVVLAVAPLASLDSMNLFDAVRPMIVDAALATVAGCGAAFGVEAAGWLLGGGSD